MQILPIAVTQMIWPNVKRARPEFDTDAKSGGEALIELAGRSCYESWHKPNPDTATIGGYLANIRAQGHFSVYEHVNVTFDMQGVSRSLTHELIRHRHFSFSELSQRFVDVEGAEMVHPPALSQEFLDNADNLVESVWWMRRAYRDIVEHLTGKGVRRKQAREAARAVMPNMTETKIVVTGNLRAWRHFIKVRGTIHADAEIRMAAVAVADELEKLFPDAMADLEFHFEDGYACVRLKQCETE
jgi:thymidylate synthase (FAD)